MRRSFRRDLLVTTPPPPPPPMPRTRKPKKRKNPSTRSLELKKLYAGFVDAIHTHDLDVMAREVGVRKSSARRWFYGYPPHKSVMWPIARYFAVRMQVDERVIYERIAHTLEQWRKQ